MRVELNLPDKTWAEVLDVAEQQSTTVARVVEAAIRDALRPSSFARLQQQARRNQIVQLVAEGFTDRQVAERTGEVIGYVAAARRAANLPPNRPGGGSRATGRKSA